MVNTTVGMIIMMAGVSMIAVFGDELLRIWIGPGNFVGWWILWIFCLLLTLENHHSIFARFGINAKTVPTWGKVSVMSGALNLFFTWIGIQSLGLIGAALSKMTAQILTNNWYAVWKTLNIIEFSFAEYARSSGILWFTSGISLLAILACIRSLISLPLLSLIIGIVVTTLLCSGVLCYYLRGLARA